MKTIETIAIQGDDEVADDWAKSFERKRLLGQVRAAWVDYLTRRKLEKIHGCGEPIPTPTLECGPTVVQVGEDSPRAPTYNHTRGDSQLSPCPLCEPLTNGHEP